MRVTQFQYWCPTHGQEIIRISMADELGQEYYTVLTELDGRAGRDMREQAIEALASAIENGDEPGEVEI